MMHAAIRPPCFISGLALPPVYARARSVLFFSLLHGERQRCLLLLMSVFLPQTVSNSICKLLPKPKLHRSQRINVVQQSRQSTDLFCVRGERKPKYASSLYRLCPRRKYPIWARARRAAAVGAREEAHHRCWGGRGGAPPLLRAGEKVRRRCLGPGRRDAATSSRPGGRGAARRLGGQERGCAAATIPNLRLLLKKATFKHGTLLHSATYILQWVSSLRSH